MLKGSNISTNILYTSGFLVPNFYRPIFIISAPRSGSTFFYHSLRKSENVFSFYRENTPMWIRIFPYGRSEELSDYVSSYECNNRTTEAVKSFILAKGIFHGFGSKQRFSLPVFINNLVMRKSLRYMEKTIANCFHIDAIEKMFPDALYVHLVRDGRATVSSMIEGWETFVKVSAGLYFPKESQISNWSYALPPNWKEVIYKPLEEICAWSWVEHNRYIVEKVENDTEFSQRYMRVSFEEFLENPMETLNKVAQFCDLELTSEATDYACYKNPSRTTISEPKLDKWKDKHPERIASVMNIISPMMESLGYSDSFV